MTERKWDADGHVTGFCRNTNGGKTKFSQRIHRASLRGMSQTDRQTDLMGAWGHSSSLSQGSAAFTHQNAKLWHAVRLHSIAYRKTRYNTKYDNILILLTQKQSLLEREFRHTLWKHSVNFRTTLSYPSNVTFPSLSHTKPPLRHALSELKAYPTSLFNELFTNSP